MTETGSMTEMGSQFADNLARVQERIAQAAGRAGRKASDITLVAVSKRQPPQAVRQALECGLLDLGENYVQEAQDKQVLLPRQELASVRWHLIGHLQSNKAKAAVAVFDLIQSVDSVSLAQAIGRQAQAAGKVQDVLVQVHLGDEAAKSGIAPAQAVDIAGEVAAVPNVALRGLMGIAPGGQEPQPYFQQLRGLFEALPLAHRQTLSMGMTGDFEAAISEGATMLRIGTALFGPRTN